MTAGHRRVRYLRRDDRPHVAQIQEQRTVPALDQLRQIECFGSSGWPISGPGPGTASVPGAGLRDPGRLQLDRPPGGVVHFRYRQAEPVPQAAEPFAAGPGDRLLQLPLADKTSRAGGGARRGCHIRCGQAAWALLTWCGRIPRHCALLGGLPGFLPGCLPGIDVAGSTLGSGGGVHHAQPPTRQPTRWPTRIRAPCVPAMAA